ncbi:MAG TPA: hypothetical protein VGN72_03460 [Tepidisphaeraceae bacterium]|nr:hypothetical protein [Tepidisphaeraceae bacterium]
MSLLLLICIGGLWARSYHRTDLVTYARYTGGTNHRCAAVTVSNGAVALECGSFAYLYTFAPPPGLAIRSADPEHHEIVSDPEQWFARPASYYVGDSLGRARSLGSTDIHPRAFGSFRR